MHANAHKQFFQAIRNGDRRTVEDLLAADPALMSAREENGTPLHFAAFENQSDIVDVLLAHGADLNARDGEFNMTPIGWANEKGHVQMVEYLFNLGAQVDLYRASAFGLIDRVRECLATDKSGVNEVNHYGAPLHEASLWGHPEIARLLLESGADPELKNVHGETALQIAKTQIESGCRSTPIAIEQRKKTIAAGCLEVVQVLQSARSGT